MGMLKRAVPQVLKEIPSLQYLIMEGDQHLGNVWSKLAVKHGARVRFVAPEVWRAQLLHPREQRSGEQAKESADVLARKVIEWAGAKRPTSLTDDAAEAILIGLWGVMHVGWLKVPPHWRP